MGTMTRLAAVAATTSCVAGDGHHDTLTGGTGDDTLVAGDGHHNLLERR